MNSPSLSLPPPDKRHWIDHTKPHNLPSYLVSECRFFSVPQEEQGQNQKREKPTFVAYLQVVAELPAASADANYKNPRCHGVKRAPVSDFHLRSTVFRTACTVSLGKRYGGDCRGGASTSFRTDKIFDKQQ